MNTLKKTLAGIALLGLIALGSVPAQENVLDPKNPQPPFDFQTQSILGYSDDLIDLRDRLQDIIAGLSTRRSQHMLT